MLLTCINKCYRIPANMIIYSSFLQTLFLQDVLSIRFNAQLIGCIFLRSRKPFYAFSRIMLDVVVLFVISSTQFDLYIIQYPSSVSFEPIDIYMYVLQKMEDLGPKVHFLASIVNSVKSRGLVGILKEWVQ